MAIVGNIPYFQTNPYMFMHKMMLKFTSFWHQTDLGKLSSKTLLWQCGAGGWFHSHWSIKQMQFDSGHCFAWLIGHEFFKGPKWCASPSAALGQPPEPRSRNNATTKPRRGEEMVWSWWCWNRTIGSTIPNLFILWMVYIPKYEWFSIALPTQNWNKIVGMFFWGRFRGTWIWFKLFCWPCFLLTWSCEYLSACRKPSKAHRILKQVVSVNGTPEILHVSTKLP